MLKKAIIFVFYFLIFDVFLLQAQEKDKIKRKLLLDEVCKKTNGQAINQIGMQIVIFKANEPSKIILP